jgi:flagellin
LWLEFKEEFRMGSFSILNNIAGLSAQNQLNLNNVKLSNTLMRLSSGKRINSGADDAAGLQIADSLRANAYALDQAVRNANDGISVSQIADGALQQMSALLARGVTLASEASTESVDSTGRASLNAEFVQINSELSRIAQQANFNGYSIFGTGGVNGSLTVFVGDLSGSSSISVTINTITTNTSGQVTAFGTGNSLASVSLANTDSAQSALTTIKNALGAVSGMRAAIGSGINRLQSAVSVLQTQSTNTQAAESTIEDANVAQEIANLTKFQILAQTGVAALSQANSSSQSVLSLLRSI